VKNYKLVTIAKELGVELENAHRAVFDAVATAEVMINLLKNN
jgi:DNA polymerase III epsilon subunit-like protein